ncbi:Adiponectin receptor protein 1 [Fusarium oxysporum f. sp. raphani]|uniref:Adiponectin receptor protein 1 n=1 Tax=Fusarium oxysporum f. sp. raphani TaxID=96318 RepID=A0A8J5UC20_FUSOX|nr:Adiponectin receptor protein 1 [Fusarium oxysporum f. sp. raphani]
MDNPSPEPRTVALHDIPVWRQGNKYILAGYRPMKANYPQVIKSLSFLHNETWNVYTHLIGAVLLPPYATAILRTISGPQYIDVTRIDFIMFNIFFCSAESCLSSSAVYHLIGSHSHEAEQLWHRRDLLGIVILTVGTFIPGIYYIFYCDPILQKIHWIIVCHSGHLDTLSVVVFCGSATAALISIPKFRTLRWRKARVSAYVALGASALIPLLHGVQVYGLEYMLEHSGMKWYLVELLLYGGGCGIYAVRTLCFPFPSGISVMREISDLRVQFRIPERIAPGHFDIWFSSHQIFHVSILCAICVNVIALMEAFTACHTLDICYIQSVHQARGTRL